MTQWQIVQELIHTHHTCRIVRYIIHKMEYSKTPSGIYKKQHDILKEMNKQ